MTTPCAQEATINNIGKTLERMMDMQVEERGERRESEARLIAALEKVADQGARIEHLENRAGEHYVDMDSLFSRVRDVELTLSSNSPAVRQGLHDNIEQVKKTQEMFLKKLDRISQFVVLLTHRRMMWIYGGVVFMVVSGTILDVVYHLEAFKTVGAIIKVIIP